RPAGSASTRVRAISSSSSSEASAMAAASSRAWASCSALRAPCMADSRIAGVDFSPERPLPNLCTKIPPTFATPTHRTLFEGIRPVPPGHFLLASGGEIRLVRYWDFDYPAADDGRPAGPDPEYAERFRRALDEAVRLHLRADVPVGCYLSGG